MIDWDAYYREKGEKTAGEEIKERNRVEMVSGPKRKEGLTRSEKALIKALKKSKGKRRGKGKGRSFRKGVVSAFGLQRGRIRY